VATNMTSLVSTESTIPNRWIRTHVGRFANGCHREPAVCLGVLPPPIFKFARRLRRSSPSQSTRAPKVFQPTAQLFYPRGIALGSDVFVQMRSFTAGR
jgi:hypothetical protein